MIPIFYRFLLQPLAFLLTHLLWIFLPAKLKNSLKLKWKSFRIFDSSHTRDSQILVHAASGEIEFAKPVIKELLNRGYKVLVTFSSPSQKKLFGENHPKLKWQPLPFDFFYLQKKFLLNNHVTCILIAKTDLWPNLLLAAQSQGIPSYVFSVSEKVNTVPNKSFFTRCWKSFLYNLLTQVFVVDEIDQKVIAETFDVPTGKIKVIGDTRYDQVLERITKHLSQNKSLLSEKKGLRLILGSTWPDDEHYWLPKFQEIFQKSLIRQIVLCPHEPTDQVLRRLEHLLEHQHLNFSRLSKHRDGESLPEIIIVDQVGILASLYLEADLAFVGGSFAQGVHSVLEPLAAGLPTSVGPFFQNNREAIIFSKILCDQDQKQAPSIVTVLNTPHDGLSWIQSLQNKDLAQIRKNIRQHVEKRRGATKRLIHHLSFFEGDATTRIPNSMS